MYSVGLLEPAPGTLELLRLRDARMPFQVTVLRGSFARSAGLFAGALPAGGGPAVLRLDGFALEGRELGPQVLAGSIQPGFYATFRTIRDLADFAISHVFVVME